MSQYFIDQLKSERATIKNISERILEKHTVTKEFWPGTELEVCIYCGKSKLKDPYADDIKHSTSCLVELVKGQVERLKGLK